ncbi:MAG TPA: phenylacetate--CoA ligase [Armatimonadota bacterium]|jgi:phenylacetate-CoA ligase
MIWNPRYECMPREQLEGLQLDRLRHLVDYLYRNSPVYRQKLDACGARALDIRSLDDLTKLPFTVKDDLRDSYPFGLFCVPMEQVVRIHSSSGTTGKPTVVGYTRADLDAWAELMARTFTAAGATSTDVVHVAYGYGLFTGGLGAHYGAEKVGASVIPISGGNTKRQVMIMRDFGSTILACTPSYALNMAEVMEEMGVVGDLKLKAGVFGAEPWTDGIRREIESKLRIKAHDIYGLSEIIGPGVSFECECQSGLHFADDMFIAEVVDPATDKPVAPGEEGELVVTCLTKQALPLLRYRTHDITRLTHEPCACGRTTSRMARVSGRTDDMLIIRGVNVFPSQIESVLMQLEGTEPHYLLVINRNGALDEMEVWVEVEERFFNDEIRQLETLSKRIRHEIESVLGLSVRVRLVEPKTIERSEGKAKRVRDLRKEGN